jgi:predicted acyl esterase
MEPLRPTSRILPIPSPPLEVPLPAPSALLGIAGVTGGGSLYRSGNNLFADCGPLDQSPVESRDDVLVFSTEPLETFMAVTGPLTATLYVSSSALDSDFAVGSER